MEPKTVLYLKNISRYYHDNRSLEQEVFHVVQLRLLYTISNTFVSQ